MNVRFVPRFPLIEISVRYVPILRLVIHSRTYGSQFIDVMSAASALEPVNDLGQKPRPAFGLVNPVLDEAGGGHVIVALTYLMRTA